MHQKTQGFGLLELLVSLSIFVGILWLLGNFQVNVFSQNNFIGSGLNAEFETRTSLKKLIAELRAAVISDTGTYPIALATGSALTFYSDRDGDGLVEQIRFYVSGNKIYKGVIKPTGAPLSYVAGNEKITTEVNFITNSTTVFTYFDANTAQLNEPINLPEVRLIKITYTVDENASRPPAPLTLSAQVSVRSLKFQQ